MGAIGRKVAIALVAGLAVGTLSACDPDPPPPAPVLQSARPRILAAGANLDVLRDRLAREPYGTIFRRLDGILHQADGVAPDDHTIGSERVKAKATKDLAFQYALDRTVVAGAITPFPDATARQAAGDTVRARLLGMYTRSRLAVPPPLGGTDRDINTSEELLQYATAYDTMLGAGYDFGADDTQIRADITDLASELYENYVHPETAYGYTVVLPNNHRSKSAAALGVAALALYDSAAPPAPGAAPADARSPAAWLAFALDQVDLVEHWLYAAPDGAYGEGPYYERYASQNLLPFARAWNHAAGGAAWDVGGRRIPDLWTSPAFRATQRWLLDTTLPNGSMAPIDDGNVDFSYYFGVAPTTPDDAPAFAWRWANAPTPYDTDGSVDLSADAIVAYDDAVTPAPPSGSATRFALEGGTAVLRGDWSDESVEAIVLGEHGAAMELGRDRDGRGRIASAAHEQPDTGSFLLHAFGERLLLDPGYLTYEQRGVVGKATDHNLVLVDGAGPGDPAPASLFWSADLAGPPPVDGQATLSAARDTPFIDSVRVTTRYANTDVDRRFFFVDDRYVVTVDTLRSAGAALPTYTWLTHGNGGGTSGGSFERTAAGGRWTTGAARVDTAIVSDAGPVTFGTTTASHEAPGRILLTHTALEASVEATGSTTRSLSVAYPSRSSAPVPSVRPLRDDGRGPRLRIRDTTGDRIATIRLRPDGTITIRDDHADRTERIRYVEGASGRRVGPTDADVVVERANPWSAITLPFRAARADHACALVPLPHGALVRPGRNRTATLRASPGNSAPAADPGPDVGDVPPGSTVVLDGRASCDLDHDALTPRWEIVAAPQGSAWRLAGASDWEPRLETDRPGPYRVRLTVTDTHGATDRAEVEVYAGPRCTGDRLQWSDPTCS